MILGIDRLVQDLIDLNYGTISVIQDSNGMRYAVIENFEIPAGTFMERKVQLAIPAPADYPRSCGASIHIKTNPHLVPFGSVPNVRNVIQSPLGGDWQYWSIRFTISQGNSTTELMAQINEVFRKN